MLSTIALALAVLAFAAQLIVSLAQAQGSAQQLTQTERVNSETQSALAEVRSTANALLTNQSDQFNKVLSALLRSATEDAVREVAEAASSGPTGQAAPQAESIDPEAVAERVEIRVRQLLANHQQGDGVGRSKVFDRDRAPLPEGLGRTAVRLFRELDPNAVLLFTSIVYGMRRRNARHFMAGTSIRSSEIFNTLMSLDLFVFTGTTMKSDPQIALSPTGSMVADLIFGSHHVAAWFREEIGLARQGPTP
ncbi:hypothetical protein [Micromonospora noduli]|uniref:hypothetical protein n=1 Tax=Micromonospora noduli TaxID=709876 RepID=UPI0011BFB453|nr:hypothetical protein [Micromonospora noduli]